MGKVVIVGTSAVLLLLMLCNARTQGRAVNISNTWTLPQEGYPVFYRFFRDKISWFEADAVCQFHHANLVTVGNGVQFDAARAFLKELDVTELVWIGLMRPQNSAHFGWSSAKQLDPATGYWADPIPVMESPLCAVIDPVRDYRWHALRCGGPETAAFLCELEVPAWAMECTIGSLPSLTFQYMSDSGSVELSRDCGEEGTRSVQCHGQRGAERDHILNQLRCADESSSETPAAITEPMATEQATSSPVSAASAASSVVTSGTSAPAASVSAIVSASASPASVATTEPSIARTEVLTFVHPNSNEEDNSIAVDVSSLRRVHELMQADGPGHREPPTAKPQKPMPGKKVQPKDRLDKKPYTGKQVKAEMGGDKAAVTVEHAEELMLGDQPAGESLSAEMIPLPHVKKTFKSDLHPMMPATTEMSAPVTTTPVTPDTTSPPAAATVTAETRLRRETAETIRAADSESTTLPAPTTAQFGSTHAASHNVDESVDHFIPPLLMVRTQFTSSPQLVASGAERGATTVPQASPVTDEEQPAADSVGTTTFMVASDAEQQLTTTMVPEAEAETTEAAKMTTTEAATTTTTELPSSTTPEATTAKTPKSTTMEPSASHTEAPTNIGSHLPHAPHAMHRTNHQAATPVEEATSPTPYSESLEVTTATDTAVTPDHQLHVQHKPPIMTAVQDAENVTAQPKQATTTTTAPAPVSSGSSLASGSEEDASTSAESDSDPDAHKADSNEVGGGTGAAAAGAAGAAVAAGAARKKPLGDLTNAENYQPYRPNRRRALTKADKPTYMKKLFG